MSLDFKDVFAKYEALLAETDALFEKVKGVCPEQVACEKGCSDCCHALFDVSLVEGLYLNHHFNRLLDGGAPRDRVLGEANRADRHHYKLKRKAFRATEKGVPTTEILADLAKERIRCPLLNDDDRCDLYAYRPVTCRLYGLPLEIGGKAHTCGKSGFTPGGKYPTVKIEKLQDRLMLLARDFVDTLSTKYPGMAEMLVPVSMALLTEYDEEYLGVVDPEELETAKQEKREAIIKATGDPGLFAPTGGDCSSCGEGQGSEACKTCGGGTEWVLPGPDPDKRGED